MQFIEELTLIHKAAIGGAVVLIALLVLVAKRRRANAAAVATADSPPAKTRMRKRAKADSSLPRRKRRKLAAEAAHLGLETPAPAEHEIPAVPAVPTTQPEPIAEELFDEEVAQPVVAPVAPAPVIEDPYIHGAPLNINLDAEVVVAQPGWPAPGELVTSFDPDAFDPVPDVYGPLSDDALCDPLDDDTTAMVEADDTAAMDLSTLSTTAEIAALDEIEEWADAVEDDEWDGAASDDNAPGAWSIADTQTPAEAVAVVVDEGDGLNDLWSEPDDEPLWSAEPASQVSPEEGVADAYEPLDDSELTWPEDVSETWTPEGDVVDATPEITVTDAWNGQLGSPNSPVVLDLAGLAASGQSLELVIEPNADGHGVRLRFGAPAAGATISDEAAPIPDPAEFGVSFDDTVSLADDDMTVAAGDPEILVDPVLGDQVPMPTETAVDVPFLAGIAPVSSDEPIEEAPSTASETPVATSLDASWNEPSEAPTMVTDDLASAGVASNDALDAEMTFESQSPASATAVMDDDPARILADIRARLAALDAHR